MHQEMFESNSKLYLLKPSKIAKGTLLYGETDLGKSDCLDHSTCPEDIAEVGTSDRIQIFR